MSYQITTQREVQAAFFASHPKCPRRWESGKLTRDGKKTRRPAEHNEYPADTRVAFCDYVDSLQKSGVISEALAQRVTL